MRSIIAFAGLKKSGKTTLAKRLAVILAVPMASFGDQVRKEALRRGLANASDKDLQTLGSELVKTNAKRFCQAVLDDADFQPGQGLILDGIRHVEIIPVIEVLTGAKTLSLIYVESSISDRKRRSSLTDRELAEIDSHLVERDAPLLKSKADLVLDTSAHGDQSFIRLLRWVEQGSD